LSDVGVFLLARNEEKNIKKTLNSLIEQELKPKKIIVIDDNSIDNTKQIAKSFPEVTIVDFPIKHPNWLMSHQFAKVYNFGLSEIKKSGKFDYVMRLDCDHILPPTYLSEIVSEMNKNKKIAVASGIIKGETQSYVRGSGRIHRASYLDLINWKHPIKWGFEDYILLKAQSLGYSTKVFPKISETQRPTHTNKKPSEIYTMRGKAYRAFGYTFPWVLISAFRENRTNLKLILLLLSGYFSRGISLYEKDFRDYNSTRQKQIIKSKLKNLFFPKTNIFSNLKTFGNKESKIYWFKCGRNGKNFGDLITSYIYLKIKGKNPIYWDNKNTNDPVYFTSGSIMGLCKGWKNVIVWGTGIINSNDDFDEPCKVLSVRGPLTRKRFLELGYNCPEIYGDPGLLLPKFYEPKINKKFKVGIIPHFTDFETCKKLFSHLDSVIIIDICRDVEEVVNDICKCQLTLSSSLHGIIISHAYGTESCWVKFSEKIIGDGVKFLDYFYSINLHQVKDPIIIDSTISSQIDNVDYFIDLIKKYPNPKFPLNTEKLFKTCPFNENN